MLFQAKKPQTPRILNPIGDGKRLRPGKQFGWNRMPRLLGTNRKVRRWKGRRTLPRREQGRGGSRKGQGLDRMRRDSRVPVQGISLGEGKEGPVRKQEIDTPGMDRPATNASGLRADVDPLGDHQGIQAMKLFKFHIEIPTNEARDPTGGLSVEQGFSAQGTGVE